MKLSAYIFALLAVTFMIGCQSSVNDECRIHGEMGDHSRDGRKVYLVPMIKPDSSGVDSTEIKDGKFEFSTQKNIMAIVRVELLSRYGLEDLLVVTEPGDVFVKIDSVSSASGTAQNDSLQQWKEYTQMYTRHLISYRMRARDAERTEDTVTVRRVRKQVDSLRREYRIYSRRLAGQLKEGPLQEFLIKSFPTSYKKKMPDGSIQEIEMD